MDLSKKTGVIFDATSGIGLKLTLDIAKLGANLIIQSNNKEELRKLDDVVRRIGNKPSLLHCDINNFKLFDNYSEVIFQKFNQIDFFLYPVGKINSLKPLTDLSLDEWNDIIKVNLTTPWYLLKRLENLIKRSKRPKVVFFYNSGVANGMAYYNAYSVAKAGLYSMANLYRNEKKKLGFDVKILELDKYEFKELTKILPQKKQKQSLKINQILNKIF